VCDFGFAKGQQSFLEAHGQLLVADPPIPQRYQHPWYRKAALVQFIARDVDAVVWLDCDVVLTGDPRPQVAALVAEMRQRGEMVAACNEELDLGAFCRNWEAKGKNTAPFVQLLHQLGVAAHRPYLNSGVFVAASRAWLAKWKEITFDIDEHFLFEQNAFNAAAWLAPEKVRLLDRRHWNLHGSDLDRISIGADLASLRCDDQEVMVVHATSEHERHVGLLEGSGRLGDKRIPVWLKIFRQPSLQTQQRALLDQFIGSHERELAEHL
jgi:lipopolysaccharide biosynthesis glycosyltransferase